MSSKKITIGLFNDTFYPMLDGVVSVVNNYATELCKYANVIVFVPRFPKSTFDDSTLPYKVVRCKSINIPYGDYPWPLPDIDRKFMKKLESYKLDIVHIHSPFGLGKVGIKYAKRHNIPVVATMHSQFKQDFKRALKLNFLANIMTKTRIRIFNKCDECWAVNSEVARIFYEDYGYKTMPRVMDNATEMKKIDSNSKEVKELKKLYDIKKGEKVFFYVGRLNKLKGVLFLANSLRLLKEKNPSFKFKMIFVGAGQDEEELKTFIKKNKLTKEVFFPGRVTDRKLLAAYFNIADLFLFPSLYDASSIVQIEAASQGTPTLFIEGAATTATITNNVNGFISKNTEEDYVNNIIRIMNDKELYNKVSKNAYKDIYINWETKIKEVYDLYLELIDKKKNN